MMAARVRYGIRKAFTFEAAHQLTGGVPMSSPCRRKHGHSFRVEVRATALALDDHGVLLDFDIIEKVRAQLDHQDLNEVMGGVNPTAENIARFVLEALTLITLQIGAQDEVKVERVRVWETKDAMAEIVVTYDV